MPFNNRGGGGSGGISTITSAVPTIAVTAPTGPTTTLEQEAGIVTPGSFGTRFVVPRVTVDTYGRVTGIANQAQILLSALSFTMDLLTGASGSISLAVGNLYVVQTLSGNATGSLPTAAAAGAGNFLVFARSDGSVNTLSLAPNGTDTIGGVGGTISVSQSESLWVVSDGVSNWTLI